MKEAIELVESSQVELEKLGNGELVSFTCVWPLLFSKIISLAEEQQNTNIVYRYLNLVRLGQASKLFSFFRLSRRVELQLAARETCNKS